MCGRFTQHSDISLYMREIDSDWQLGQELESADPTWNLAPSQEAWVIVRRDGRLAPVRMNWGLRPAWAKPSMSTQINARVETAAEKPYFREAWRNRRCVVPADGYYEWQEFAGGDSKQPMYISLANERPMLLAGLYVPGGFAVITQEAVGDMAEIHSRAPVVLPSERVSEWMGAKSADAARSVLASEYRLEVSCYPVSDRVNDRKNNEPKLVLPTADPLPLRIRISHN